MQYHPYTTEGNVVHYGYIEKFIEALGEKYNIREIAFDRWGAVQMVQNLEGMGFTVVPFGQGFKDMSPPTKELMKLTLEEKIAHGGHPVLRWMMDNIFIRTDPAGNIKPDKEKSTEKIDGAVATIILTNEKYKGDALLQKRFTVDFLMKTMKVNEGEVPQYYVENSHEAIIDPTDWDIVQAEIARRKTLGRAYSGNSVFSSRVVCGDCGSFFGQKVWHSNDAYRKVIWRCNGKFKGEKKCTTPHLEIETIQQKFLFAYNQLMLSREGVISDCNQIRNLVSDCTALDAEIDKLTAEIEVLAEMVKSCVKENAASVQSQEEYTKKYNALVKRYEKTSARLDALAAEKSRKQGRDRELRLFIESIKKQPLVLEVWSERLWVGLLDRATVFHDDRMVFQFKNGTEIEVEL